MITDFSLNIGGSEWVVIILLGLFLLFGAKKLPQVSKSLGRVIGEYNRAKNTIQDEITQATKPFTTQSKFDSTPTPRLPTRQETKTPTVETKTEAATDTTVKVETSTATNTAATDSTITSPVVSEREKLEVIARTLEIEPRGKSTDELKQLISSKMNQ